MGHNESKPFPDVLTKVYGEILQEKEESWWLVIGGPKSALVCDSIHSETAVVGHGISWNVSQFANLANPLIFREPLLTLLTLLMLV